MAKTALVVLGMHRSGTSSVAGTLTLLGAAAPKVLLDPSEDNPKGFWEGRAVVQLNDRILRAGESWWSDWRRFKAEQIPAPDMAHFHAEMAALLEAEFGDADTIVLKDPRLCRIWPLWEDALARAGYSSRYILPVRSPLEAARSLSIRNGMSMAEGLALWLRHVLDAERVTRGQPRCLLLWSEFMRDWRAETARIAAAVGWPALPLNALTGAAIDDFLTPDLQHQRNAEGDLAGGDSHAWAAEGFRLMADLVRDDSSGLHRKLDVLARRFETASDLFGRALGPVLWQAHAAPIFKTERDRAREETTRLKTARDAATRALETSRAQIASLSARSDDLEARLREDTARTRGLVETAGRLSALLATAEARLAQACADQEALRSQAAQAQGDLAVALDRSNARAVEAEEAARKASIALDELRAEARGRLEALEATRARLERLEESIARRPLKTLLRAHRDRGG